MYVFCLLFLLIFPCDVMIQKKLVAYKQYKNNFISHILDQLFQKTKKKLIIHLMKIKLHLSIDIVVSCARLKKLCSYIYAIFFCTNKSAWPSGLRHQKSQNWLLGPTKWARVRTPLLTLFYKTVLFLTTYKHGLKIVILVSLFIFKCVLVSYS